MMTSNTLNRSALSPCREAQTTTLSVDHCQNRELMELMEIQAEHLQQRRATPAREWAEPDTQALEPERPSVARLTGCFVAACAVVLAATVLALWWV